VTQDLQVDLKLRDSRWMQIPLIKQKLMADPKPRHSSRRAFVVLLHTYLYLQACTRLLVQVPSALEVWNMLSAQMTWCLQMT
jgi:hypothetical protein